VCMQPCWTTKEIVELFIGFRGEPMAGVAVDAVVFHQSGGVDAPTLAVEGIGGGFGEGAGKALGWVVIMTLIIKQRF